MPRTSVPGEQLKDGDVQRVDLDVTTPGESVITKILTDNTLEILTSTGADPGTGDVTLSLKANGGAGRVPALSTTGVPGGGTRFLEHGAAIPHTKVPIIFSVAVVIEVANVAVDQIDSGNTYELQLFSNPSTAPVFHSTLVTLPASSLSAEATGLTINVAAGNYGLALVRTAGSGSSVFKDIVGSIFVKEQ